MVEVGSFQFIVLLLPLEFVSMAPASISQIEVGHIDDVQELRKLKPAAIPERFIRDMAERPTLTTMDTLLSSTDIPVIDFSQLLKGKKTDEFQFELSKLAASCQDWGFFQVKNTSSYCSSLNYVYRS